jgi:hypothetical protein
MGLKGYRLWALGQLDSNVQSPTTAFTAASRTDASRFVAAHVDPFESKGLKPGYHVTPVSRVETRRVQAMCKLDSRTYTAPPVVELGDDLRQRPLDAEAHLAVALQVAFERQTLKPVFHLIGYRLWV